MGDNAISTLSVRWESTGSSVGVRVKQNLLQGLQDWQQGKWQQVLQGKKKQLGCLGEA